MTDPQEILIVDPDAALRALLATQLRQYGAYRVLEAADAETALAMAKSRDLRLDAIVSEAALPDGDGCDLCARLRSAGIRIPILMLAAVAAEQEVVRALDAGANDYVAKPVRVAELAARLRTQIRLYRMTDDAVLGIGPYRFQPSTRSLFDRISNRRIRLNTKECEVLRFLAQAGDQPVGRKTLLKEVWGYDPRVESNTVETTIWRLRRKIDPDQSNPPILVHEGGGYRLSGGMPAMGVGRERTGMAA